MATAYEFKKLAGRVESIEGQTQGIKDDMSSLITKWETHENTSKTAQNEFMARTNDIVQQLTVDVPSSVNSGITSSIDTVKARITEELKDYIDRKIGEVTASIMYEIATLKTDLAALSDD